MAKRRANGDGTLRKRDDGRWEGRIVIGTKKNGQTLYKGFTNKSQKEVLSQMNLFKEKLKGATLCEDYRMTLGEWLPKWLDEHMAFSIRESTKQGYSRYIEYIKPYLGHKQVSAITTADVQKMYNKLKESGRKRCHPTMGHQLSDSMVRSIHMMLHEAMAYAMREHMILKNPTEGTTIPRAAEKEMQILNETQIRTFMEAIRQDEIWYDFFYLELMTGLRRGEICALKWSDFDEAEGKLAICRTLHEDGTTGDTKTYSGMRSIKLPESAADMLRERKKTAVSEWIFPNPLKPEKAVSGQAAYNRLKKILKDCNLPDIRFHDLRHTFATQAVAGGVDPKSLSHLLGHTKASFSLDRYTHVTNEMQAGAAAVMGNFLDKIIGNEVDGWAEEKTAREA
ncbi:MAG: site-specific integrase [Clostridia bacterium]|nr:site-specific integrase [Clostridia bacterium]